MRLKYGPRGHTVNTSSRIEGATKHLGVPVLIASSTQRLLGEEFLTRRVCQVHVVGIEGTVELFELRQSPADAAWLNVRTNYEQALSLYESGQWSQCLEQLTAASAVETNDAPSRLLLRLAKEAGEHRPEQFDPAFKLDGK
jgi:adenylate cyclase